jgi:hypothetical protein
VLARLHIGAVGYGIMARHILSVVRERGWGGGGDALVLACALKDNLKRVVTYRVPEFSTRTEFIGVIRAQVCDVIAGLAVPLNPDLDMVVGCVHTDVA